MTTFKALKNTDKEYPCTQCGETNVSIVREDPKGLNPRCKCNGCGFMFNGDDSAELAEIKASSSEALAHADEPDVILKLRDDNETSRPAVQHDQTQNRSTPVPDRPAYVFLSKPRGTVEFCTKRDFRATAVKWHTSKCDVYELKRISFDVKVGIK